MSQSASQFFRPITRRGFLGRAAVLAAAVTAAGVGQLPGFKGLVPPAFAQACNIGCGPCDDCVSNEPGPVISPGGTCACYNGACVCPGWPDALCAPFAACMFCCDGCAGQSGYVFCLNC